MSQGALRHAFAPSPTDRHIANQRHHVTQRIALKSMSFTACEMVARALRAAIRLICSLRGTSQVDEGHSSPDLAWRGGAGKHRAWCARVFREVRGARLAKAELRAQQLVCKQPKVWVHSPALAHDQHLQLWLDSQGAVSACTKERGFCTGESIADAGHRARHPAQFRVAPSQYPCRAKGGRAFQASRSQRLAARARVCAATNV